MAARSSNRPSQALPSCAERLRSSVNSRWATRCPTTRNLRCPALPLEISGAHCPTTGGWETDSGLGNLRLVPPFRGRGSRLPPPRVPVFTRIERPLPIVQPPPPLAPPVEPPLVQPEAVVVSTRYLEIRIVVPIDDMGNVREEVVMKLPADWLERLPMILRRLPDDRYRIYLMLSGGGADRLVIAVFVPDGRPVEPAEAQTDTPPPSDALLPGQQLEPAGGASPADGQPALLPAGQPVMPGRPPVPATNGMAHW